eukprot:Sspe_Gene.12435::Locus_4238_Transcript_1_2_Confidence_0.667_Length_2256::g.12435::m.12435
MRRRPRRLNPKVECNMDMTPSPDPPPVVEEDTITEIRERLGAYMAKARKGPSIWSAAEAGDVAALEKMIQEGVDVNAVGIASSPDVRATPVYFAAAKGHEAAVMKLLEAGALVDTVSSEGLTPCDVAMRHGSPRLVDALSSVHRLLFPRDQQQLDVHAHPLLSAVRDVSGPFPPYPEPAAVSGPFEVGARVRLSPFDLCFLANEAGGRIEGTPLATLLHELLREDMTLDHLPPLRAVHERGRLHCLDTRYLLLLKEYATGVAKLRPQEVVEAEVLIAKPCAEYHMMRELMDKTAKQLHAQVTFAPTGCERCMDRRSFSVRLTPTVSTRMKSVSGSGKSFLVLSSTLAMHKVSVSSGSSSHLVEVPYMLPSRGTITVTITLNDIPVLTREAPFSLADMGFPPPPLHAAYVDELRSLGVTVTDTVPCCVQSVSGEVLCSVVCFEDRLARGLAPLIEKQQIELVGKAVPMDLSFETGGTATVHLQKMLDKRSMKALPFFGCLQWGWQGLEVAIPTEAFSDALSCDTDNFYASYARSGVCVSEVAVQVDPQLLNAGVTAKKLHAVLKSLPADKITEIAQHTPSADVAFLQQTARNVLAKALFTGESTFSVPNFCCSSESCPSLVAVVRILQAMEALLIPHVLAISTAGPDGRSDAPVTRSKPKFPPEPPQAPWRGMRGGAAQATPLLLAIFALTVLWIVASLGVLTWRTASRFLGTRYETASAD